MLCFVPVGAPLVWLVICIELAQRFGHGASYGLRLAVAPFVVAPVLGFGRAEYAPTPVRRERSPRVSPGGPAASAVAAGPAPGARNAQWALILGTASVAGLVAGLFVWGILDTVRSPYPSSPSAIPVAVSFALVPGIGWAVGIGALWCGVRGLHDVRGVPVGSPRRDQVWNRAIAGLVLAGVAYAVPLMFVLALSD